jgi:hypothetical protein
MDKEEFFKLIENKENEYSKKDPCKNCGPGNGCDDCRGCEDAKVSHSYYVELKELKNEYKKKFNSDYDKEKLKNDFVRRFDFWKTKLEEITKPCKECHSNFEDDCLDCDVLEKKLSINRSLKLCKEEYKKTFNEDYEINIEMENNKDSFIISAEDARKMVQKEKEQDNECLKLIMEKIKIAIKKKENYCYIGLEEEYVLDKLRKLGYTISDIIKGDRYFDGDYRKISW